MCIDFDGTWITGRILAVMSEKYILHKPLTPSSLGTHHSRSQTHSYWRDCCCSVSQLYPTLWDPMGCSMPGFPAFHLPELAQTHVHWVGDAIQPFGTSPLFMSSSNCTFLTCIQVSQEAGKVVWYSHVLKNFPQFVVTYMVKCFRVSNKADVDSFLEFSCFFYDPVNVGNLISGSSGFSKSSLNISSQFM